MASIILAAAMALGSQVMAQEEAEIRPVQVGPGLGGSANAGQAPSAMTTTPTALSAPPPAKMVEQPQAAAAGPGGGDADGAPAARRGTVYTCPDLDENQGCTNNKFIAGKLAKQILGYTPGPITVELPAATAAPRAALEAIAMAASEAAVANLKRDHARITPQIKARLRQYKVKARQEARDKWVRDPDNSDRYTYQPSQSDRDFVSIVAAIESLEN